jgi:hypothetical protein
VVDRHDLIDAREALRYWEERERALPRRARRARREAADHAARWRERVAAAERDAYGAGLTGALVLLATEGRLPQPVREAGRRATGYGRRAMVVAVAAISVGFMLVLAGGVAVTLAMLGLI